MKNINKQKEDFLLDTLDYYCINPSLRRNVQVSLRTDMPSCYYYPLHDETEGCAIGRKLVKKLAKELDKFGNSGVSNPHVYNCLPKKLQRLGNGFLADLQQLHDSDTNWDKDFLSYTGRSNVLKIINLYNLSKDKFTQYLPDEQ